MREAAFLKQNAPKWKNLESYLAGREKMAPDDLADFFIQLTDDLSYARTFYPKSNTTKYLNTLTAKLHQEIYRNKRESHNRFLTFWKVELPRTIKQARAELFYAFAIFGVAISIGGISAANDDTFVRLILGDSYVNQTLENIKSGDPMRIYKEMHQIDMFLGITFNNIRVAFLAFVAGVLLSFGTALVLFYNGVMLGVFHYFFYEQDLLNSALRTIWIHGTLEISAIIVAGAAGLVIGNSLLFPGTYTRKQSFMRGARNGLKMVVGLVPVFITAGFLEGFVTRYTNTPTWLSLAIIAGSLAFVIYYFIVYPLGLEEVE
ncbi:stage II sporulation protein M [candidate division KSB1 bacterium]|nr:stage II sporulation protein M [candidate division KSB1 bacterium]NIR70317.1 stage II sporulation protein M [candidate division KSB1 bacterium]NIS27621.1 stage II sporulation protein M [candidate division KSB1 bacterium]NIT74461.1 stage II sporulation protein M [candidate division KSB1 bacterium]NIU28986.1 stage II sporulation protein M [candidate division KSB1 bacterium]